MSWDLFTSAAEAGRDAAPAPTRRPARGNSVQRHEELAQAVALELVDRGLSRSAAPGDEWTVSAVNSAAREMVEGVFPPLWVVGEITNFTRARSGHCYFTLRDADSQLRCVMWRDEARRLPTMPQEGMKIRALGRLTLYEARGEFQLVVSDLEAKGDGLWKLALERLRTRLEAEGLTSPHRKRPLPRHPRRVGVVTSASGAVFHDIVKVIGRRAPWTEVVLCGCRVQGDGAAEEIAAAIRLVCRSGCVDVLIIGRGGGSIEDLWAFNEEVVARAISESSIPTISAVGHETDVTIADLVADLRAPTPSAAAEAAVPDGETLRHSLRQARGRMGDTMRARLDEGRSAVRDVGDDLARAAGDCVARRRERLQGVGRHLHALSPLAAFNRGFSLPLDGDGRVLRRVADFPVDRSFDLLVNDGVVPCRVEAEPRPRGGGGE